MSYVTIDSLQQEMTDIHVVHAACMLWRMRCLSHRLLEFGWEQSVKHLSTAEALCLASIVPPTMHDEIVRAAYLIADERWKAFITKTVPRLVPQEAVTV